MSLSPIVLFVYARPDHTRRTLETLADNELAPSSELFVFVDGPRDEYDKPSVDEVRRVVDSVRGFARVEVIQRAENYGLARNIIEGVTEIIERHGRVIVLEDDIVTSRYFLDFMNAALERYTDDPRVWHVSGWNYPVGPEELPEAFFWRGMNCWGWATWRDRWAHFEKDPERLIQSWSQGDIKRFNLDGTHDFWSQVVDNYKGRKDTWAIFWYATIYERDGLCLNPARSFVRNIGHDGSGEHCGRSVTLDSVLSGGPVRSWPSEAVENVAAVSCLKRYMRSSKSRRWLSRVRRLFNPVIRSARR